MSSSAPPPSSGRRKSVLGLTPRAWLYVAIAFAVGIGLFLLIWAKQRAEDDFYRADTSRQSATGQVFEPLPQPDSGDAGLDNAPPAADDGAPSERIVETQPPPPPPGTNRTRVVEGKSGVVRVGPGCSRYVQKNRRDKMTI